MENKIIKTGVTILGVTVIVALIVGIVIFSFNWGEKKAAITSCEKLKEQSKEYVHFFVTQWQKDMCDTYDFTFAGSVDAPVHVDTMRNGGDGYLEQGVWYTNGLGKWTLEVN